MTRAFGGLYVLAGLVMIWVEFGWFAALALALVAGGTEILSRPDPPFDPSPGPEWRR